jgi:hypothetical protein
MAGFFNLNTDSMYPLTLSNIYITVLHLLINPSYNYYCNYNITKMFLLWEARSAVLDGLLAVRLNTREKLPEAGISKNYCATNSG